MCYKKHNYKRNQKDITVYPVCNENAKYTVSYDKTKEIYGGAYLMNAGLNLYDILDEDGDSYLLHLTEV
mgnify:CR=1 FL=1